MIRDGHIHQMKLASDTVKGQFNVINREIQGFLFNDESLDEEFVKEQAKCVYDNLIRMIDDAKAAKEKGE